MTIQTSQLTKVYRKKSSEGQKGFQGIDLNIKKGEIFGLLGPNGAGKTTLLKVLSGLLKKDSGEINILGTLYDGENPVVKGKMGGMIGNSNPYPYLTARENVEFIAKYYPSCNTERINEVLKNVELTERQNDLVKSFSTGMKQRLAFAMAIVHRPEVLFLDEPFNGLDIEGKVILREMIKETAIKEKMTVVISSHLIHDVEEIADTIGIIMNGRMIVQSDLQEVLKNYRCLEDYFIDITRKRRLEAV